MNAPATLVSAGDARLHVVRRGDGPPLLFLVGLGGRAEFWLAQMARFADRFCCLSFDHRATGDSLPSDVKQTVAALAADAISLLDALEIERTDIVGHSLGGAIAQHIAVHHPERVGRLVLSASWAGPTPFFSALFDLRKQVLRQCGPSAYLLQGALLGNPGWWNATNAEDVLDGVAARMRSFAGTDVEMERMDAVCGHDLRARLPEIRAQTLVLCALDDQITPPPLSEEIARLIPGAALRLLDQGNHFAPVTMPDRYAEALNAFLA